MDHLHAYWRMEYIEAPRLPEGANWSSRSCPSWATMPRRSSFTAARCPTSSSTAIPYNPGHLLAIPFRAATDLTELTAAERADLMDEIILGKEVAAHRHQSQRLQRRLSTSGTAAGGSIPHLHAHIVPRWNGDTNFMPVIGQTRVLPQVPRRHVCPLKDGSRREIKPRQLMATKRHKPPTAGAKSARRL